MYLLELQLHKLTTINMNNMKKSILLFLVAVGVALSFAFVGNANEPNDVVFVRGYIMVGGGNNNSIKIYRGSAPVEIMELEKVKGQEGFDGSITKILETVNKFTADGYSVVSSTEFGGGAVVILDFTLSK
jgi:hypothetical protein